MTYFRNKSKQSYENANFLAPSVWLNVALALALGVQMLVAAIWMAGKAGHQVDYQILVDDCTVLRPPVAGIAVNPAKPCGSPGPKFEKRV